MSHLEVVHESESRIHATRRITVHCASPIGLPGAFEYSEEVGADDNLEAAKFLTRTSGRGPIAQFRQSPVQLHLVMTEEIPISDIANVIRLAVAPVFLLTANGTLIATLNTRLGRVVDRSRSLEAQLERNPDHIERLRAELKVLSVRIRLAQAAIALAVLATLFVCLLISCAFIGAFVSTDLTTMIGVMFVIAMLCLIGALLVFLREIFLAVKFAERRIR